MPVIPAIQEAEAGESSEPGRQRLQWAKIVPLHSSLGNRVKLRLKIEKRRKEKQWNKNRFFEKVNIIDKILARMINRNKERRQITNIRNEWGDITTDSIDIINKIVPVNPTT